MNPKAEYREFLKSEFWRRLTAEKKALVRRCEKCRSKDRLQSHHVVYREDWFQTKLEDLIVLCRVCHAREHGKVVDGIREYPGRNRAENKIFHHCGVLSERLQKGGALTIKDQKFLSRAIMKFPATKRDGAIEFHVSNIRRLNLVMNGTPEESAAARLAGLHPEKGYGTP